MNMRAFDKLINKYELFSFADRVSDLQIKYPVFANKIKLLSQQDPSNNKYLNFSVKQLLMGASENEISDIIKLFHKNYQKLPKKDINQYANLEEVKRALLSVNKSIKEIKIEGADKIYEDNQAVVIRVLNKAAACFYGANTKWCITIKNEDYLDHYHMIDSIIYVILRKDLNQDNDKYKIGISVSRQNQNIEYFNAKNKIIDESSATNSIVNWNSIKQLILTHTSKVKNISKEDIINTIKNSKSISLNIQRELVEKYYDDYDIMSLLIDKAIPYLSLDEDNLINNLKEDIDGEVIEDENHNLWTKFNGIQDIMLKLNHMTSNKDILKKLNDIGFEKEALFNGYKLFSFADKLSDLQKKFPAFSDKIKFLASKDPSGNQKYLEYGVKVLVSGKALEQEIADVLYLFHKFNPRLQIKDINQYLNFTELRDLLFSIKNSGAKTTKEKKEIKFNGAEKKYEDDQVLVLRVKDKAAACFYGANTKWCITMNNESYFEDYDANNFIFYFLLRKDLEQDDPYYKVAISVQRDFDNKIINIEYWDAKDNQISANKATNNIKNFQEIFSIIDKDAPMVQKSVLAKLGGPEIKEIPIEEIKKIINDDKNENIFSLLGVISKNKFASAEILQLIFDKLQDYSPAIETISDELSSVLINLASNSNIDNEIANEIYLYVHDYSIGGYNFLGALINNSAIPSNILQDIAKKDNGFTYIYSISRNKNTNNATLNIIFDKIKKSNYDKIQKVKFCGELLSNENIENDLINKILNENPSTISDIIYLLSSYGSSASMNHSKLMNYLVKNYNDNNELMIAIAFNGKIDEKSCEILLNKKNESIIFNLAANKNIPQSIIEKIFNGDLKSAQFLLSNPSVDIEMKKEIVNRSPKDQRDFLIKYLFKGASAKNNKKISLKEIKQLPPQSLLRLINKAKKHIKKDEVWKKICDENDVDISIIDYIPTRFGTIPVSATTNHGIVTLNYKLLCDGDFEKDWSYLIHEFTHMVDQCFGKKATQSSDDGEYLQNPHEQKGFSNQVEYIANNEGEKEAEEYVEDLLDHHEIKNKKEKDELSAIFLENV